MRIILDIKCDNYERFANGGFHSLEPIVIDVIDDVLYPLCIAVEKHVLSRMKQVLVVDNASVEIDVAFSLKHTDSFA
jgi:hypothetical protein